MKQEFLLTALFFAITAVFFYLFFQIMVPFFVPICWAAVFAVVFFPLYEKLLTRIKSRKLTSLTVCFLIIVLIIGPLAYLFTALVNEAADAVAKVNAMYKSGQLDDLLSINLPWMEPLKEKLSQYYDLSQVNLETIAKNSVDEISGAILNQTSWLIANGTKAIFYFALMIFTMYYFFTDGEKIIDSMKRLMPLPSEQVASTFGQLREVIQATMYGGLVVALAQGLIGGILFAAVGIPSALFWGAIMAFLSIIPFVGAFIIYVPAGIILIIGGSFVKGLVVIAVGILLISQIDNVVRPYLISGRTSLHPLLLFFTIMGGIFVFGLLGIVLGPIIAAVFITLLRMFELSLHPEPEPEPEPSGSE